MGRAVLQLEEERYYRQESVEYFLNLLQLHCGCHGQSPHPEGNYLFLFKGLGQHNGV